MFSIHSCDFGQENKSCFVHLSLYTDDSKTLMLKLLMGDKVNKELFTAYGLITWVDGCKSDFKIILNSRKRLK